MQFAIHESNLERLQKKINRIRTKCEKYGCDFLYEEIGEEFRTRKDDAGVEHIDRYILVECEGTAKINGWRFAATIDHFPTGNIIRKMLSDVEVPEKYYTAGPECEHCHSQRHRKDTYLVYNDETKEFKQVGSTCLCDFTGGFSAEAAASYIALFDELIKGEAPGEGGDSRIWEELTEVLSYAVDFVNHIGYSATTDQFGDYNPDSTKVFVTAALDSDHGRYCTRSERERIENYRDTHGDHHRDDEVAAKVAAIIEYFQNIEDTNDYLHNLKVLAASEYVDRRNIGYVVSMVAAYNRHLQKIEDQKRRAAVEAAEAEASNYLGEVGQRIEIAAPFTVDVITSWDTPYGSVIRYKITDSKGNIAMWDSSSYIDPSRTVEVLKGTIKKLDVFRGVKQTWITRCRASYSNE